MAKRIENVQLKIEDYKFPNKGTAKYNGLKAEIPFALPGQTVRCNLLKKKGRYITNSFAVEENADYEIPSDCQAFGSCGGCTFRTMPYEKQLELKKNTVLKLMNDAGIEGFDFKGIKASPSANEYRNKMEFSFGDTGLQGELALGMRKRGSFYEVADASQCKLVHPDITKILRETLDFFKGTDEMFYHKMRKEGALRHLLVRRAAFTGEILVALITTSQIETELAPWCEKILALPLEGSIAGVLHIINDGVADVVKADKINNLFGRDYIHEKLLGLTFKISVFSFFQTNSAGAEVLYQTVADLAKALNPKYVFDLYCGTGTIAQLMSRTAEKVIGIEIVEEAVAAAETNAALNNITNCTFIADDVLKGADALTGSPDLIILDPPREGLHPKALEKICRNFNSPHLIYVSCKPTSLTRDLLLLRNYNYVPKTMTCVDMFPHTPHVETVVYLSQQKQCEADM